MIPTSRRYKQSVVGTPRWATRVEWTRDGKTWLPASYQEGQIVESVKAQVHWKTEGLVLTDVEIGDDALSPFGSRFRISVGMVHSPTDIEWVPKGVYRLDSAKRVLGSKFIEVAGSSMEQQVIDARLLVPRQIEGDSARDVITSLLREVLPSCLVSWRLDTDMPVRRTFVQRDRWSVIDGDNKEISIAKAMGARVYCDSQGVFVISVLPSLDDPAVFEAKIGERGVQLRAAESLTRTNVRNVVVVYGSATDGVNVAVGPGVAKDLNPRSPTYTRKPVDEGGFGEVPTFFASPFFTKKDQCDRVAQRMLGLRLGLKQQVDLDQIFDPSMEAGDVGSVIDNDHPERPLKVLVDVITLDPARQSMRFETRSMQTRFAGQVTEAIDDPEEQQS